MTLRSLRVVLKGPSTILKVWARKSGLVRFSLLSIVVVTAFLALHMVSCSSSPPPSQPSPPPPPTTTTGTNVTTYHNDNARTGQNLSETILTPSNVNSSSFGKLFVITVDGKVDAQPLYLTQVSIPNQGMHNVLYVATEHGSVYGFDADNGKLLWQISMLAAGETTSDDHGCGQITPEIGVTATPVIDTGSGPHGTIYVVAMSKDGTGNYHQRLHALDATTGAEQFGGPQNIQATYPGSGSESTFDPKVHKE